MENLIKKCYNAIYMSYYKIVILNSIHAKMFLSTILIDCLTLVTIVYCVINYFKIKCI